MNKVYLIGNLTKDVELAQTPSGVNVAQFTIAVSRPYANANGDREADFHKCIAWRGLGERIAQYCKKGDKIAIVGSLQNRSYEDKNGGKRYVTEVVVSEAEFLTPKKTELERAKEPELEPIPEDEQIGLPF